MNGTDKSAVSGMPATDAKGYLLDAADWNRALALEMAATDGIQLGPDHWAVLDFFRSYFANYEIEPPMRVLVKWSRDSLGADKGSSRFLYRLFPQGPVIQASRYGGLPRPASCL